MKKHNLRWAKPVPTYLAQYFQGMNAAPNSLASQEEFLNCPADQRIPVFVFSRIHLGSSSRSF